MKSLTAVLLATFLGKQAQAQGATYQDVEEEASKTERFKFMSFIAQMGKEYRDNEEFMMRLRRWKQNDNMIEKFNSLKGAYKMAHNMYTDWTDEEVDEWLSVRIPEEEKEEERRRLRGSRADEDRHLQSSSCNEGQYYYRRWGSCRNCGSGCAECTGRWDCDRCKDPLMIASGRSCYCPDGMIEDSDGMCMEEVKPDCGAGQYWSDWRESCRPCTANCIECSDSWSCEACGNGWELEWDSCVCPSGMFAGNDCLPTLHVECEHGSFRNANNECQPCGLGCGMCENETGDCMGCIDGSMVFTSDTTCGCFSGEVLNENNECVPEQKCGAGQYHDYWMETCMDCDPTCAVCGDKWGYCYECASNYIMGGSSTDVCWCPEGMEDNGMGCREVFEGCPPRHYTDNDGECQPCGIDCVECKDGTGQCTQCITYEMMGVFDCSCPWGTVFDEANSACVPEGCPDGQYQDYYDGSCQPCANGCALCEDQSGFCSQCVHPSMEIVADRVCQCPAGTTMQGQECVSAGFSCEVGTFLTYDGQCQPCGDNCDECGDYEGACTKCSYENMISSRMDCYCEKGEEIRDGACRSDLCGYSHYTNRYGDCLPCAEGCEMCDRDSIGTCYHCVHPSMEISGGQDCVCPKGSSMTEMGVCKPDNCGQGCYVNSWGMAMSCGFGCDQCSDGEGMCEVCSHPSLTLNAMDCVCPTGSLFQDGECICPKGTELRDGGCFEITECGPSQYLNWDNECQDCGDLCAECNDQTGTCTACFDSMTMYTYKGFCRCEDGYELIGYECIKAELNCPRGQGINWDHECEDCDRGCLECGDPWYECLLCDDAFTNQDGTCRCPGGYFAHDNSRCYDECPRGQYPYKNDCQLCQENCAACSGYGRCEECVEGFEILVDGGDCVEIRSDDGDCDFPVGPAGNPHHCAEAPYSELRMVAPFPADSVTVDWREQGVVNPIRAQLNCGSCYAFSAVNTIESSYAIKYGTLYEISEQHLVDCQTTAFGCSGGWMTNSYKWWAEHGGVISREDYPYISGDYGIVGNCREDDLPKVFEVEGGQYVQEQLTWPVKDDPYVYSKELFLEALRQQPLAIGMGIPNEFLAYSSGIYTGPCDFSEINHAMNAVGYGYDSETDLEYAIIRNSWGTYWGEDGYARVALGVENDGGTCMLWSWATYPDIA